MFEVGSGPSVARRGPYSHNFGDSVITETRDLEINFMDRMEPDQSLYVGVLVRGSPDFKDYHAVASDLQRPPRPASHVDFGCARDLPLFSQCLQVCCFRRCGVLLCWVFVFFVWDDEARCVWFSVFCLLSFSSDLIVVTIKLTRSRKTAPSCLSATVLPNSITTSQSSGTDFLSEEHLEPSPDTISPFYACLESRPVCLRGLFTVLRCMYFL